MQYVIKDGRQYVTTGSSSMTDTGTGQTVHIATPVFDVEELQRERIAS